MSTAPQVFSQHHSMFEEFRSQVIKPEITLPKAGLFRKQVTMQTSLERNRKASEERKRNISAGGGEGGKAGPRQMVNVKKVDGDK